MLQAGVGPADPFVQGVLVALRGMLLQVSPMGAKES
jgi:hypothetical protein